MGSVYFSEYDPEIKTFSCRMHRSYFS